MTPSAAQPRQQRAADQSAPPSAGPSAVGAQRRLRALAARSWSPQAIEKETRIPAPLISSALYSRDDITQHFAQTVADAYDRLWNRDPPNPTPEDREACQATALRAARSGWAPPLAWDDDQIDLPGARPERGWKCGNRITRRAVDLVEDAEFVREHGGYQDASVSQVAMRLGIKRDRLEQAYFRARRYAAHSATKDPEAEAEAG
jgi:hypothetical protein